jgi:hypothetical protein
MLRELAPEDAGDEVDMVVCCAGAGPGWVAELFVSSML